MDTFILILTPKQTIHLFLLARFSHPFISIHISVESLICAGFVLGDASPTKQKNLCSHEIDNNWVVRRRETKQTHNSNNNSNNKKAPKNVIQLISGQIISDGN